MCNVLSVKKSCTMLASTGKRGKIRLVYIRSCKKYTISRTQTSSNCSSVIRKLIPIRKRLVIICKCMTIRVRAIYLKQSSLLARVFVNFLLIDVYSHSIVTQLEKFITYAPKYSLKIFVFARCAITWRLKGVEIHKDGIFFYRKCFENSLFFPFRSVIA